MFNENDSEIKINMKVNMKEVIDDSRRIKSISNAYIIIQFVCLFLMLLSVHINSLIIKLSIGGLNEKM